MDKIESLKYKIANDRVHPKRSSLNKMSFISGFDAAMELQLPVRFMEWAESYNGRLYILNQKPTIKQLYDHYLENIYQPEK